MRFLSPHQIKELLPAITPVSSRRRLLTREVLALLAVIAFAQSCSAADQATANAELLDEYFAAVNAHDVAGLKDLIAENYVQHDAGQGRELAGMQAAFRQYLQTFPDFHMMLEDGVITNDKIVARFQITATHDHPVQLGPNTPVFPPTGKKLSWQGISIWRVADGKFAEHWDVEMRSQPPGRSKQP